MQAVLRVLVGMPGRPGRSIGRGRRRHSGHRTRLAAALALVATALLVPSAAQPAGATSEKEVTFTVALVNEVDSFNPFLGFEAPSFEMWALTYDYLTNYSMKDMSPTPGLAKSWKTSKDGRTWTFDVRDGVKWSDGVPLTAADVAYTYTRVLGGGLEATTWASYLDSVTSATAPDATTLVLKLSRPNSVLPLLPIPIIPEHIWKDVSEKELKSYAAEPSKGEPVVGSGPFRLVEGTASGSTYRFEKNPDYWQGAPHVDEVAFRVFKSDDPAVQALIKGEVDFVEDITALQVKALQGRKGTTARNGVSPLFEEIAFNTGAVDTTTDKPLGDGNPALRDKRFRHALGYAVDRDRLIKSAHQGAGEVGSSVVPSAYGNFHWEPPKDDAFTFDLEKAGRLLDEAGYKRGADGIRTMPDGKPIAPLRLFARSEEKSSVSIMDFFKEWLGDLGIRAKVSAMESNKLTETILEGEYDAFQWNWYVEPDPDAILDVFTCAQRGGYSDSWYCNPEYDALNKAQSGEMDETKRVAITDRMQKILYDDAPYLVTAYTTTGEAVRSDRFACFEPQPDPGGVLLVQYGAHNYVTMRPADQAGDCDGVTSATRPTLAAGSDGEDGSSPLLLGVGVAVAVLVGGAGVLLALRRRGSAGERE